MPDVFELRWTWLVAGIPCQTTWIWRCDQQVGNDLLPACGELIGGFLLKAIPPIFFSIPVNCFPWHFRVTRLNNGQGPSAYFHDPRRITPAVNRVEYSAACCSLTGHYRGVGRWRAVSIRVPGVNANTQENNLLSPLQAHWLGVLVSNLFPGFVTTNYTWVWGTWLRSSGFFVPFDSVDVSPRVHLLRSRHENWARKNGVTV